MIEQTRQTTERPITVEALAALGGPNMVYIRQVSVSGGTAWGIFAQNGQPMGVTDDRDSAFAAARQHELEPLDAH